MEQRLLNGYEEVTYEALNRASAPYGAHVFPKVRVADVLRLENSGIPARHYSYGLRSHFDFVVTDQDYKPLFSVEFDGPLHQTSRAQRHRDSLKNDLCEHFNHSLLRINSRHLTKSFRGLDLLTYFVDAWFLEAAFDEAQRNGSVPYDEPFDMTFVFSTGASEQPKWPYWLSLDIQLSIQRLHDDRRIGQMAPSYHVGLDEQKNYRCLTWIVFDANTVAAATSGVRAQRFPAVCKSELASMLAMFELYPKIQDALSGNRTTLVDRRRFFENSLPAFEARFPMVSAGSVGATL